jgi:hypothetical protein
MVLVADDSDGRGERDGVPAARAAYRCLRGHVIDPATTPQSPACRIHDTLPRGAVGSTDLICQPCAETFSVGAV